MGKALAKKPSPSATDGVLPAVASAMVPGLGQLINGQGNKALGLFVAWFMAGLGVLGALPLGSTLAGGAATVTWVYSVTDSYVVGKKRG